MPYVQKDPQGNVIKASSRDMIGYVGVPYNDPALMAFCESKGINYKEIDDALAELKRTDGDMSRAIEDVITVLLKKNLIKMSDLPKPVQDKMALRVKLRAIITDAYDRASASGRAP